MSKGLFTKEELEEMGIDVEVEEESTPDPNAPRIDWIVYYTGGQPDTVWSYHHNPEDGIPFGRLEGYWDEDKEEKVSRHYVSNQSTNLKLMDYDEFMEHVVPNKDCTKIFKTEEDFLLELL